MAMVRRNSERKSKSISLTDIPAPSSECGPSTAPRVLREPTEDGSDEKEESSPSSSKLERVKSWFGNIGPSKDNEDDEDQRRFRQISIPQEPPKRKSRPPTKPAASEVDDDETNDVPFFSVANLLSFATIRGTLTERIEEKINKEWREVIRVLKLVLARHLGEEQADTIDCALLTLIVEAHRKREKDEMTKEEALGLELHLGHTFVLMLDHHELSFIRDTQRVSEVLKNLLCNVMFTMERHMSKTEHTRIASKLEAIAEHNLVAALYTNSAYASERTALFGALRRLYKDERLPR